MSAGSTPARRTTSRTTTAARSSGRTSLKAPLWRPIGVRTASTITASGIVRPPQGTGPPSRPRIWISGWEADSFTHPTGRAKALRDIPLLRGMRVEIGCGARVRDFDGRRYFYFWHYERENGRSLRREEYVGRVDSDKAKADLLRRMAAYHRKAEQEFARRRARIEQLIAAERTST